MERGVEMRMTLVYEIQSYRRFVVWSMTTACISSLHDISSAATVGVPLGGFIAYIVVKPNI